MKCVSNVRATGHEVIYRHVAGQGPTAGSILGNHRLPYGFFVIGKDFPYRRRIGKE